jgi:hypothetical protein
VITRLLYFSDQGVELLRQWGEVVFPHPEAGHLGDTEPPVPDGVESLVPGNISVDFAIDET